MIRRLVAVLLLFLGLATSAAAKPLVVILADARGTVATDLLAPYAILAESGAVEVTVAASTTEPIRLMPGQAWVAPQTTLDRLPREPDVVIVPAFMVETDPVRAAWLHARLKRGTRIMSICNGAIVLAEAGLLKDRQATVHWYSVADMKKRHPDTTWRQDGRWIQDGPIMTTAGISAGEPGTLELLRQLAGEQVMRETAARLQLPLPDPRHDGRDYHLTAGGMTTVVLNTVAFWRHEDVAIPLTPGFDELAFGTTLDAWSRTYRSTAWAEGATATRSRHGLVIHRAAARPKTFDRRVALPGPDVMVRTFDAVRAAYGEATARFVALQFEHPYGGISARRT